VPVDELWQVGRTRELDHAGGRRGDKKRRQADRERARVHGEPGEVAEIVACAARRPRVTTCLVVSFGILDASTRLDSANDVCEVADGRRSGP